MTDPARPRPEFDPDVDRLRRLRQLVDDGTVRVECDRKRLTGLDSPVQMGPYTTRWALALVVLVGAAFYWVDVWAAGGVAVVWAIAYMTLGQRGLQRGVERRVRVEALENPAVWRKLWRHGGVRLVYTPPNAEKLVRIAPEHSWIRFIDEEVVAPRT